MSDSEAAKPKNKKTILFISIIIYSLGLYLFYIRYVPLVKSYQLALVPIITISLVSAAVNMKWGILFFVFLFPLINNLPYFFGIHEPLPHAPAALVLFLFFFLGWLINRAFSKAPLRLNHRFSVPLIFFSLIVLSSGLITFWRFSNFAPLLSDRIYDLAVNVRGVTAGAAIMSTVFFSLNYLTALAFFFILFHALYSLKFMEQLIIALGLSSFVSFSFGIYQHLSHIKTGNNPVSISLGLINATMKDALSCGAYIAILISLFLGAALYFKRSFRFFFILIAILGLYLTFFTGSKVAIFSAFVSLVIFSVLAISKSHKPVKTGSSIFKRMAAALLIGLTVFLIAALSYRLLKTRVSNLATVSRIESALRHKSLKAIFIGRTDTLWNLAFSMIKDYPLTGLGLGGYIVEVTNYAHEHKVYLEVAESAENYLLQVGAEMGIVGVLLVFWIFWEIIQEIRKGIKRISYNDKRKFLFMAAVAGIVAHFINIQGHTYIGSYEIKYAFWLLVSLIFALLGQDESEKATKIQWNKSLKIVSLIIIVIYSGLNLWYSTHSLSLAARAKKYDIKQNFGFYQLEKTSAGKDFRWTKKYAGLTINMAKPVITIPLLASHPDVYQRPVHVGIYLVKNLFKEKTLIKEIVLSKNTWETYEFYMPEKIGQEIMLLFKVSRTWNPLKWRGTPDPRNLGIAVGRIDFRDYRIP